MPVERSSSGEASAQELLVSPARLSLESGLHKLEFPIEMTGGVVYIEWDITAPRGATQPPKLRRPAFLHQDAQGGLCGGLPVAEVAVLGAEVAKPQRSFSPMPRVEQPQNNVASRQLAAKLLLLRSQHQGQPQPHLAVSQVGDLVARTGEVSLEDPTAADSVAGVASLRNSVLAGTVAVFFSMLAARALAMCIVGPIFLHWAHWVRAKAARPRPPPLGPLLRTAPEQVRPPELQQEPVGPAFFFIGDSAQSEAEESEPRSPSSAWFSGQQALGCVASSGLALGLPLRPDIVPQQPQPQPQPHSQQQPQLPPHPQLTVAGLQPQLDGAEPQPQVSAAEPPAAALLSPAPRSASCADSQPSMSEPEPEEELYPEDDATASRTLFDLPVTTSQGGGSSATLGRLPGSVVAYTPASAVPLPRLQVLLNQGARAIQPCSRGVRRISFLYASPLCYIDPARGPLPMTPIPSEREWAVLLQAIEDSVSSYPPRRLPRRRRAMTSIMAQPLSAGSLQRAVASGPARGSAAAVLHLSAHGTEAGALALEDGKGGAHFLGEELLRGILGLLRQGSLRLVVLNACNSLAAGHCFLESGVPHVICASSGIRDSWGHRFLRAFYAALFQGHSVKVAFEAAVLALRCDPEVPASATEAFTLLPNEGGHGEVLFPSERGLRSLRGPACRRAHSPASSSSGRAESPGGDGSSSDLGRPLKPLQAARARRPAWLRLSSPFETTVPALPEDFVGRALDVWAVLQILDGRRAVAVCGGDGTSHGIGKSAVLDAVHRAFTLQLGGSCVAARLRSMQGPEWIERVRQAVHQQQQQASRSGSGRGRAEAPTVSGLEALVEELAALTELRQGKGAAGTSGVLLILDECDGLAQQWHFQEELGELLRRCATCRVLLSTQRRMASIAGGQFKVVHHALQGLSAASSARLFLRRVHRPLHEGELPQLPPDAELCEVVAALPAVQAQRGNPRGLIELAGRVVPALASVADLADGNMLAAALSTVDAEPD